MIDLDFSNILFEPKDTDRLFYLNNRGPYTTGKPALPVNLDAIAYYASLGMTPRYMAPLIGTTYDTIWNNAQCRVAYDEGRCKHILQQKYNLLKEATYRPSVASALLDRAVGGADVDYNDGLSPEDQSRNKRTIKFELVAPSDDLEIQEIKEMLERRALKDDDAS